MLLGTVKGDIHDIGKDIVNFMLDVNGFQVTDLGVDVPMETFVEEIKSIPAACGGAVRLSDAGLRLNEGNGGCDPAAGLRDKVKIMVGGGTMDEQIRTTSRPMLLGKTPWRLWRWLRVGLEATNMTPLYRSRYGKAGRSIVCRTSLPHGDALELKQPDRIPIVWPGLYAGRDVRRHPAGTARERRERNGDAGKAALHFQPDSIMGLFNNPASSLPWRRCHDQIPRTRP